MKTFTKKIDNLADYIKETISSETSPILLEQLRVKEYSQKIPEKKGARRIIVPWSGGLDSTASLIMALETGSEVITVNFNYGQSYYEKELFRIKKLREMLYELYPASKTLLAEHYDIDISWLDQRIKGEFPGDWKHIFPLRNYVLLMESSYIAKGDPAELWFSCVRGEVSFSGGDKSSLFITEMKRILSESHVNLVTPLYGLEKADLINWAKPIPYRLELLKNTISCFDGEGEGHCGKCKACFNRGVAFAAANVLEHVGYEFKQENFKAEIANYKESLLNENYYSLTRREQLQNFISILENND